MGGFFFIIRFFHASYICHVQLYANNNNNNNSFTVNEHNEMTICHKTDEMYIRGVP